MTGSVRCGILVIDKDASFTSHDVVAKLRGILHQKKIGHTGTLDPMATGVLPVCLGRATKLCDHITEGTKVYEAGWLLGTSTDTYDTTGTVTGIRPVTCSREMIEETVRAFTGTIRQLPPMYSARKVDGKKLYEYARKGKEVERREKTVTVKEIRIEEIRLPHVKLTVTCSKGTYVRSLLHDMGEALSCGGCMESLRRTAVLPFTEADCHTLPDVQKAAAEDRLGEIVLSADSLFSRLPEAVVSERSQKTLENGGAIPYDGLKGETDSLSDAGRFRVYDAAGNFAGIYKNNKVRQQLENDIYLYEVRS